MLEGRVSTGWAGRDGTRLEEDDEQSFSRTGSGFVLAILIVEKVDECLQNLPSIPPSVGGRLAVIQGGMVLRTEGISMEYCKTKGHVLHVKLQQ